MKRSPRSPTTTVVVVREMRSHTGERDGAAVESIKQAAVESIILLDEQATVAPLLKRLFAFGCLFY